MIVQAFRVGRTFAIQSAVGWPSRHSPNKSNNH
jgi:hypothetical protein